MKTPNLVYVPELWRWLCSKVGLKFLKTYWDPEFSEGAFIYGSTQAICRITEVLSISDRHRELKNLVTAQLYMKLKHEMNRLTETQKKIIVSAPQDIKLLIPISVQLFEIRNQRICCITLRSLAVKWHDFNGLHKLGLTAIETQFIRDFTDANKSEWTVNIFDIIKCSFAKQKRSRI